MPIFGNRFFLEERKHRNLFVDWHDAGDYDPIDARADEYTQHHLGDITA